MFTTKGLLITRVSLDSCNGKFKDSPNYYLGEVIETVYEPLVRFFTSLPTFLFVGVGTREDSGFTIARVADSKI